MFHALSAILISLCLAQGTSPSQLPQNHPQAPTLPGGHPETTHLENDPDLKEPPPANPKDVDSIDAIVGAYYASLSGPKGQERNWDRLRSLFQPMARLIAARPVRGTNSGIWVMEMEEYIAFNKTYMERGGYFEKEIHREVQQFGNIAQVWSTYESRQFEEAPEPYSRGIYSVQLLKDGDRWWIVNMYWDYERADAPIPAEYLP
ncbi:MAG: hypothetical protein H6810_00975 [Phycisphaeraceae bacterium]|nr:MAG: hypothetical protein H6810_00975 [Phycisphaeraceae bacterium]